MRWYEGDIAQAVSISKSKNAIFVVYVEGKDDKSINLTSLINDIDVSSQLESNNFVAIKVEAGSVSHNQFTAIYKNVPVPSLFFIGKNGKPIDIIVESSSVNDLTTRINTVVETHTGISFSASQQSTSTKSTENFIKNEQLDEAPPVIKESIEKPANVKCDNGVCHIVSDNPESSSTTNETKTVPSAAEVENTEFLEQEKSELTKEEKIERAKELVEMKREAKKQEEDEAARMKEMERRKAGQDVQKLRRWQQDQELKNMMEERQRAKNEEKAARDRILAQIAQDKADRVARFASPPPATSQPSPESTQRPSTAPSNSHFARLQFKLPDGSSKTQNFESTDTLEEVRSFVANNLDLPFKNFILSTTFPRREFTPDDLDVTLRDLELCPNAVILVLPATTASAVVSSQGGGFMSLIWFLLSPILGFFGYFRNLIFGEPEDDAHQRPERNKRVNGDILDQPRQPPKRKTTETTVVRRQGNVHRLHDRTDSDDENNTWNGNSTQQM